MCTSMISPSAPAAMAERDMGRTRLAMPVEWLGSMITGKWESCFNMGTADMSRVFRVQVSKVRIPRSQRITCSLPPAIMYSALISNSSRVLEKPRLSRTGFLKVPRTRSNS